MSNCWAIAIGINQYQYFQPLNYAQRDAQALRDFLVEEARMPSDQCFLITDSAESVLTGAPVPNRDNILEQVKTVCQALRPDDVLWFFFSGYGVRLQGRDYLVPLDGHAEKLPLTAIALDELFQIFETVPKSHVILALDINRSQGVLQGQGVGDQTILLAERQNRVLFLSCHPEQFSQETLALRHGFFTAALIEGLRYENCLTPEALSIYLQERLPELTEHHWRPVQEPVTHLPTEEKHVLLLPQEVMLYASAGAGSSTASGPQLPNLDSAAVPASTPLINLLPNLSNTPATPASPPILESERPPQQTRRRPSSFLSTALADPFWRSLLTWGSAIVLALLLGVLVRNRDAFWGPSSDPSSAQSTVQPLTAASPQSSGEATLQQAIATIGEPPDASLAGQATAFTNAIAIAQEIPRSDPAHGQAQEYIQRWQLTTLDLAKAQAAQGDYRGAIVTGRALLPTENDEIEASTQQLILAWGTAAQNKAILEKAYALAKPDQASSLNEAIGTALTIPNGQPFYEEAQASIDQWSQTILQLATARATAGDYALAVQSAQLVPPGTIAYENAQAAIAEWQEQQLQESASSPAEPAEESSDPSEE